MMKSVVRFNAQKFLSKKLPFSTFVTAAPIRPHLSHNSNAPAIEYYRSAWPDPDYNLTPVELPKRTVPDSALRFTFTATFDSNSFFFYPHLKSHPGDIKVYMKVFLKDLGLSEDEQQIFKHLVGPRMHKKGHEVKLVCTRFTNRIENKKYLMLLLEQLIAEAKSLNLLRDQFPYTEPEDPDQNKYL